MSNVLNTVDVNNYGLQPMVASGGSEINLQSKTATPTTNQQTIQPDTGYNGLSSVTVNAVTSSIDNNITAENIKKDISILGVTGTYNGANVPDWSQIGYSTVPVELIGNFTTSKTIYDNWDSTQTNLTSKFNGNQILRYMPLIDTHNAQITTSMFQGCKGLEAMPVLDLSNVTSMNDMFVFCSALSTTSLNNILQMLTNATSYAGTKTLQIVGLTKNQATYCQTLSNWDAFVEAGWTTGY